jgi:cystathionine beta-lyase/cystathionine gamma-synthase
MYTIPRKLPNMNLSLSASTAAPMEQPSLMGQLRHSAIVESVMSVSFTQALMSQANNFSAYRRCIREAHGSIGKWRSGPGYVVRGLFSIISLLFKQLTVETRSGPAALFLAITALAQAGSNIVVVTPVSESSAHQFRYRLPALGISARFVQSGQVVQAIDEHTKGVFVESISCTDLLVADIKSLAGAAHEAGVPLVV